MAATLVHVGVSWTVPVSDGIIHVAEQTVTPNDASDINDASVSEVRIHHAIRNKRVEPFPIDAQKPWTHQQSSVDSYAA